MKRIPAALLLSLLLILSGCGSVEPGESSALEEESSTLEPVTEPREPESSRVEESSQAELPEDEEEPVPPPAPAPSTPAPAPTPPATSTPEPVGEVVLALEQASFDAPPAEIVTVITNNTGEPFPLEWSGTVMQRYEDGTWTALPVGYAFAAIYEEVQPGDNRRDTFSLQLDQYDYPDGRYRIVFGGMGLSAEFTIG